MAGFFMNKKIAIQGFEGSFHQEAAGKFFKQPVDVICCSTFKQAFAEGQKQENYGAVIAIENSNAGSILPNYSLLHKSKMQIVGEVYLNIKQHLLANKGIQLAQIKEVHSHPMALLQCNEFLGAHQFKLIETEDTALSAKKLKQHHSKHIAAVAGKMAAQLYNLDILVPNIHNDKQNTTRFLILANKQHIEKIADANKATLYFRTTHTKGALAKVLTIIAQHDINLSKLQSFPVSGSYFQYYFYADVEFVAFTDFEKMNVALKFITTELSILGTYKNGK